MNEEVQKNGESQIEKQAHTSVEASVSAKQSLKYQSISRLKDYLQKHFELRYNEISNKIEYRALFNADGTENTNTALQELTDSKVNSILLDQQKEMEFTVSKETLRTILSSDFITSYNPLREYFDRIKLGEYDGRDYIGMLASRVTAEDQEVFAKYFRIWFRAVTACAYDKATGNDLVLLFKGPQGIGKTRFLRSLVPEQLQPYLFEGNLNPTNKDHERHLAERFLIILDEYDTKSDKQAEAMKSLITRQTITSRKPYAINSENMARIASFCGTTNRENFLKDPSGSRRYIIIPVTDFNHDPFEHLDKAYTQAFFEWQSGVQFFLGQDDIKELNDHNMEYMEVNVEEEFLMANYMPAQNDTLSKLSLTATQITEEICKVSKLHFSSKTVQHVGMALKKNGFRQRKTNGSFKYDVVKVA